MKHSMLLKTIHTICKVAYKKVVFKYWDDVYFFGFLTKA